MAPLNGGLLQSEPAVGMGETSTLSRLRRLSSRAYARTRKKRRQLAACCTNVSGDVVRGRHSSTSSIRRATFVRQQLTRCDDMPVELLASFASATIHQSFFLLSRWLAKISCTVGEAFWHNRPLHRMVR